MSEKSVSLHPEAALRGDEHVLPPDPRPQSGPEQAFSLPEAVALRGVESGDPQLERPADRSLGFVRVEPTPFAAERPGPEGDPCHLELGLAQTYPLDRRVPLPRGRSLHVLGVRSTPISGITLGRARP